LIFAICYFILVSCNLHLWYIVFIFDPGENKMATIRPFAGVRYNIARLPDLSPVITQPYDRIPAALQQRYLSQHPNNYVRLVKNPAAATDNEEDSPYTRARDTYRQWMDSGILQPDPQPAVYVYHQTYTLPDGSQRTRKAFIAALELVPFDEGTILPHERTLSGPKVDRLKLFEATGVNFEPIFMLYPDGENRINTLLDAATANQPPTASARETYEQEVLQQLWVVTDADVIAQVVAEMAPKRNLIVADGHHRYETALAYRDAQRARGGAAGDPGFDFVLISFVGMEDPGLVILPTHRLVHSLPAAALDDLAAAATPYFDIQPMPDREALQRQLRAEQDATAFGFVTGGACALWRLKDGSVMDALASDHVPAWRALDVSVLHTLVLEKLLGLTPESIARQENLRYLRETEQGFQALDAGEAQCLFMLNPTRMEQVRDCAAAGEKMPQKSTDFYPKMVSGLVLMPLLPPASDSA
jgi:uncharacterized protein (DUF1015 family)